LQGNLISNVSASTGKVFWSFFRFTSNESIHCYQLKICLQFDFIWRHSIPVSAPTGVLSAVAGEGGGTFGKLVFFMISALNVKSKNMNCRKILTEHCIC